MLFSSRQTDGSYKKAKVRFGENLPTIDWSITMKLKFIAAAALAALLGSSAASAGEDVGWYVLGAAGWSNADSNLGHLMSEDRHDTVEEWSEGNNDFTLISDKTSSEKNSVALKLVEGYRFNDYFAVEGGYYYLGRSKSDNKYVAKDSDDEVVSGKDSAKITGHMLAIDAVGILPINERFELFAKAGVGAVRAKLSIKNEVSDDDNFSKTKYRLAPKLGIGAEYYFVENWAVRAEYERVWNAFKYEDAKVHYNLLTVGVKYLF